MDMKITPKEWQILSAYIDGQLNERERRQLETRLQSQPELRSGLEDLKRTRAMLRSLPKRRAPRNFTLTPEMVNLRQTRPVFPIFRLVSAVASFLLIITFLGELAFYQATPRQALSQPAADSSAMESFALKAPDATETVEQAMPFGAPAEPPVGDGVGDGVPEEDPSPESSLRAMEPDPTLQAEKAMTAAPPGMGGGDLEETPMGMLAAPESTREPMLEMVPAPAEQQAYPSPEELRSGSPQQENAYPSAEMNAAEEDQANRENQNISLQEIGRMFDPGTLSGAIKLILVIVAVTTGLGALYLKWKSTI